MKLDETANSKWVITLDTVTKLIVLAYISSLQRFNNDEVKASSEHNVNIADKTYAVKFNDIGTLEEGKSYKL